MTALLAALALLGPVVVHDAGERSPLGSVGTRPGTVAHAPVVYERVAGPWHQFWMLFASNDQDRGVLRTGRHAGDWEMVQVRVDAAGRPVEAVYSQHSGAERCGWSAVSTRGERFVVYLANGSHAAYFRPGVRDRMWPDPNDHARGARVHVRPLRCRRRVRFAREPDGRRGARRGAPGVARRAPSAIIEGCRTS